MHHPRALVIALALAWAVPAAAQLPQAATEVPVFPGAVSVEPGPVDFTAIGGENYENPIQILEQGRLTWQVDVPTEDVFRWYRDRIPSRERPLDDPDFAPMAGDEFAAFHVVEPHDLQREGDGEVMSGAEIRQALVEAGRRPLARDLYVQRADFLWTLLGAVAGEHTDFYLQLIDEGLFYATEGHRTTIDLQWSRYLAGDAAAQFAEDAEERERDERFAERSSEMAAAPSVEQLGVSAYAGARYDPELSTAMSSGDDARAYVFFTDDDAEAVRSFYEAETGRAANDLGSSTYVIAIEGSSLMPDHGIMIGSTAGTPYASRGATMFMVRRVIEGEEEDFE